MTQGNKTKCNKIYSILMIGCLAFVGSCLVAQFRGIPVPYIYDEFSYILAGDTFAHGRVTNPPHPMWMHFETFHELMQPTYMSKYPPGQGFFLALGQIIFGHPIYGVWLSSALMCAAIVWMLFAWVPTRWALLGGLVSVLQFGVFTYWSQSYWGGSVAALGGALVFGALPRVFKDQRVRDVLWLGLGFTVLAYSRPFEGILVGIPIGFLLLPWKEKRTQKLLSRTILLMSTIVLITLAGVGAYNQSITKDAKTFPHSLFSQTYSSVPSLIWQPLRPSVQQHPMVLEQYEIGATKAYYSYKRTWNGFWLAMTQDSSKVIGFYFGYPLALGALFALFLFMKPWQFKRRYALGIAIFVFAMAAMYCRALPHYFSSLTCCAVLWMIMGLRVLSLGKIRKVRIGVMLVFVLIIFQLGLNIYKTPIFSLESLARGIEGSQLDLPDKFTREQLKSILLNRGGKHLVIIKQKKNGYREWVFNDADIDHSSIVWARDLGEAKNAQILSYFKGYQVHFIGIIWRGSDFNKSDER